MNIIQFIKKYQLVGIIAGLIFAHFDHHISLYEWVSEQIEEAEVVEDKKWWQK
jgi:hypothetical protein